MQDTPARENSGKHSRGRVVLVSAMLHALLLATLLHRDRTHVMPMRLPGELHGSHLELSYVPGRSGASAATFTKRVVSLPSKPKPRLASPSKASASLAAEPSPSPNSSQGNDGLGEGDVTIALMQFFPDPKPDLSQLPSGTRGDVILYAIIGADGKIERLTLTSGLGHGVDQAVIATVEQWTFHPATRNGKPVPSEQEFHFHYERS